MKCTMHHATMVTMAVMCRLEMHRISIFSRLTEYRVQAKKRKYQKSECTPYYTLVACKVVYQPIHHYRYLLLINVHTLRTQIDVIIGFINSILTIKYAQYCIIKCTYYTYARPTDRNAMHCNHIVDVSHASRVPSPTRIICYVVHRFIYYFSGYFYHVHTSYHRHIK